MKTKLTMLLGLTTVAIVAYATIIGPPYDNSKQPKMILPVAYERAIAALGSDTNQFHCISANITTTFSEGEWYFTFYSTNSSMAPKLIAVKFDGNVIFDNGYR